jgi:hypothetical protein
MRSRACRREASRNVQGRRYLSVRLRVWVPAVTTDKERMPGDWRHAVWFFFATGVAIFTGLWMVIRLELWLGLAPRPTQNPSSARHADRHHRCRRMPTARHPGLCRSLKTSVRSRLHAGPSRPGTASWPDIPSGPARPLRGYIPAARNPAAAAAARPAAMAPSAAVARPAAVTPPQGPEEWPAGR